jgi:hypothetical protein
LSKQSAWLKVACLRLAFKNLEALVLKFMIAFSTGNSHPVSYKEREKLNVCSIAFHEICHIAPSWQTGGLKLSKTCTEF